METSLLAIGLVVVSSITGAIGGFLFKLASKNLSFNIPKLIKNLPLISGFVLFGLSALVYIFALRHGSLNTLYPLSSLTYIWSTIMAKKFLKEKINLYKWMGILLIVLGSALIVS
ncbi:MAG: EamA family transporter [Nanoarchaeota archaeon]|nr:EamA family transporter [Nanoarchaeota archaeon]MBU0976789.1 EamA family transporter [Nanoarchaeota archaeon]